MKAVVEGQGLICHGFEAVRKFDEPPALIADEGEVPDPRV